MSVFLFGPNSCWAIMHSKCCMILSENSMRKSQKRTCWKVSWNPSNKTGPCKTDQAQVWYRVFRFSRPNSAAKKCCNIIGRFKSTSRDILLIWSKTCQKFLRISFVFFSPFFSPKFEEIWAKNLEKRSIFLEANLFWNMSCKLQFVWS